MHNISLNSRTLLPHILKQGNNILLRTTEREIWGITSSQQQLLHKSLNKYYLKVVVVYYKEILKWNGKKITYKLKKSNF